MSSAQAARQSMRDDQGRYAAGSTAAAESELSLTAYGVDVVESGTSRAAQWPCSTEELAAADALIAERRRTSPSAPHHSDNQRNAAAAADIIAGLSQQIAAAEVRKQWPQATSLELDALDPLEWDDPDEPPRYEITEVRDAAGAPLASDPADGYAMMPLNELLANCSSDDLPLDIDHSGRAQLQLADVDDRHGRLEPGSIPQATSRLRAVTRRYYETSDAVEEDSLDELTRITESHPEVASWEFTENADGHPWFDGLTARDAHGQVVHLDDQTAGEASACVGSFSMLSTRLQNVGTLTRSAPNQPTVFTVDLDRLASRRTRRR